MSVMEQVVNDVERDIRNEINQEVTTDRIGELVLQQLKDIDQVAYVRFASVYRKFDNIDSFMEELKALKKLDAKKPNVVIILLHVRLYDRFTLRYDNAITRSSR